MFAGPRGPKTGRLPWAAPQAVASALAELGADDAHTILFYDDSGMNFAARAWLAAQASGLSRCGIVDGGWQAWCEARRPVSTQPVHYAPGRLQPVETGFEVLGLDEAAAMLAADEAFFIDARPSKRWLGKEEPHDPVAGRVPGSVNRPPSENLQGNGRLKAAEVLEEEFEALLEDSRARTPVHYCGSGLAAALNYFSMVRAGLNPGRFFAGGWSQWCVHPSLPVER